MQESSVNHTTRLYRRDLDNMPGSGREYLNPVEEDTEFMFLSNAIALSGTVWLTRAPARNPTDRPWSKIAGDFIAVHSTPVALREAILYVRVLQPALHYELEQISKLEIPRKLKQRFGSKIIRDVRFRLG